MYSIYIVTIYYTVLVVSEDFQLGDLEIRRYGRNIITYNYAPRNIPIHHDIKNL